MDKLEEVHDERVNAGFDQFDIEEEVVDFHGIITGKSYYQNFNLIFSF